MKSKGSVLIFTFFMIFMIAGITVIFLDTVSFEERRTKYLLTDKQIFNIAEAGLNKAVWYLEKQDSDWRGTTTESFGGSSYTYTISNLYLEDGATASADSQHAHPPSNAIDNNENTYWMSLSDPPQAITIIFPSQSNFSINKVRLITRKNGRPKDYQWQVSQDGLIYTTVSTVNDNDRDDRTDIFPRQSNVNYLRLVVNSVQEGNRVRVHEIEIPAIRIVSLCSMDIRGQTFTQTITQDGIVDGSQFYIQPKTFRLTED